MRYLRQQWKITENIKDNLNFIVKDQLLFRSIYVLYKFVIRLIEFIYSFINEWLLVIGMIYEFQLNWLFDKLLIIAI